MDAKNDFVIIEPIRRKDDIQSTIPGFQVKTKFEGEPQQGYVRFISKQIKDPECQVDDRVLFNEPRPNGFKIDGVGYIPVKYENIIGKIENDD